MNDSFSQTLLLAIVQGLRNACSKNIKSENFTVISGFLSFDVDSKVQHRFIINELVSTETSGERHSSYLKVIDWNCLSRRINSQRNEHNLKQSGKNQSPVTISRRGGQIKSRCGRTTARTRQKYLSGPVTCCHFTGSRNKRSNQTFTLEDFQFPPGTATPECNVVRNFSSATISLASQQISPDHQDSSEMSSKVSQISVRSYKPCSAGGSTTRSLSGNNGNKVSGNDSPNSCLTNKLSDQLSVGSDCSQAKTKSSIICIPSTRANRQKITCSKDRSSCQKPSYLGKDYLRVETTTESSKISIKQIFRQNHAVTSGDSDVSIDSIRPRYLVKHNDELLLPCPNLSSKYNKHLATTKNNNRIHSINLSNCGCEESVPNPSHISTLLSSIIGALSHSSSGTVQDTSDSSHAGQSESKLTRSAETVEESSNDSLKSVSSLETDSFQSNQSKTDEISNGKSRIRTTKIFCKQKH